MIKKSKLNLAFLCLAIFSVGLTGGFFFKPLFILAVIALAGYVWIDKQYLRCPDCGGFENLDRLFYAKCHTYHCRHCGKILKIEKHHIAWSEEVRFMKKSSMTHIISLLTAGVIIAGMFFGIGYKTAYIRYKNVENALNTQTFYAVISDIRDDTVEVTGMEINDINFRGKFVFRVEKETKIIWRYTDIAFRDLDTGDRIAITFAGAVMETSPMQITQVKQIQLLDDEVESLLLREVMDRIIENHDLHNAQDYENEIEDLSKDAIVVLGQSESGKYKAYGFISPEYGQAGILIDNIIDGESNWNYFDEYTWSYSDSQPILSEQGDYRVIFTYTQGNGLEQTIYFDTFDTGTMSVKE